MGVGGRNVPHDLVDQDPVDELHALYVKGEIDEPELEEGLDRVLHSGSK